MAAKKASKGSPKKKTVAKKGGASKADFIRSLPASTPASEVVAKAKAAGIEVTPAYVYVLRSNANRKAGKLKARVAPKAGATRGKGVVSSSPEIALRRAVAELGLTKAREIFAAVEKAFAGS